MKKILLVLLYGFTVNATTAQSNTFPASGNVGIGTLSPQEKLHTEGTGYFHYSIGGIKIDNVITEGTNNNVRSSIISSRDGDLEWDAVNDVWTLGGGNYNDFAGIIHNHNGEMGFVTGEENSFTSLSNSNFRNQFQHLTITGTGLIGIGTRYPDAKLTVKGNIHAREVKVDLAGAVAPDFVFEKDYPLASLTEVKNYIDSHKHLPDMPSASEMKKDGMLLKEMNLRLLKKIEELTLYLLEKDEQVQLLEARLSRLEENLAK